jgi:hypothetical protein
MGAEYCSLDIAYTAYMDPTRAQPGLMVQLQNPRLLVSFRFVADMMQAVDIIQAAVSNTAAAPHSPAEAGAAAPAAAEQGMLPSPAVAAPDPAHAQASSPGTLPLEVIIQVQNIEVLLPTSAESRRVLGVQIDEIVLSVPGDVMPSAVLDAAELPSVDEMVEESVLTNRTFKYSSFHEGRTQASTPAAAGAQAGAAAAGASPSKGGARGEAQGPLGGAGGAVSSSLARPELEVRRKKRATLRERVADAVAEEAVGSWGSPTVNKRRPQKQAGNSHLAGVLFFEEATAEVTGQASCARVGVGGLAVGGAGRSGHKRLSCNQSREYMASPSLALAFLCAGGKPWRGPAHCRWQWGPGERCRQVPFRGPQPAGADCAGHWCLCQADTTGNWLDRAQVGLIWRRRPRGVLRHQICKQVA